MSLMTKLRLWLFKNNEINNCLTVKGRRYLVEKAGFFYCDKTEKVINTITIITREKIRYTITFYLDYKLTLKELEKRAATYLELIKSDNKKFIRECKITLNNDEVLSIETKF